MCFNNFDQFKCYDDYLLLLSKYDELDKKVTVKCNLSLHLDTGNVNVIKFIYEKQQHSHMAYP